MVDRCVAENLAPDFNFCPSLMESVILSDTTTSTTLAGYGEVGWRLKKPLMILGILGGFLILVLILLWWGLSASFSIPVKTNALIVTTPKTARQLLNQQHLSELPPVWRFALEHGSHLPVVLGAYLDQEHWGYFAIIPRWQKNGTLSPINQRFFTIIKDQPFPQEKKMLRYREALGWWTAHPLSDYVVSANLPMMEPFFAHGQGNILSTDLPLSPPLSPLSPTRDDVSLLLPSKNSAPESLGLLLRSIRLGDWSLMHLGLQPLQVNLAFDQNLKPTHTSFIFPSPLDDQQIKNSLASLGITKHKTIQLADGTVVVEQLLPENPSALQGKTMETPNHRVVSIQKNEIHVGILPLPEHALPAPQACPKKTAVWGRFSGELLTVLLKNFALSVDHAPTLQLGSYQNKLILCFEVQ